MGLLSFVALMTTIDFGNSQPTGSGGGFFASELVCLRKWKSVVLQY